ncbi:MAG: penicillin-binding protein 2 [Patescibacteria group bacterium]|nr:penicillin-binding protein 2 [Patescibacteria group bacterium]
MRETEPQDLGVCLGRIKFVLLLFAVATIVGVGRLFYLQVITHERYADAAISQHWAQDVIQPERGAIYVKDDMAGGLYPLADNESLDLVFASPEEIENKAEVAERLAPIIENGDRDKIQALLENNHTYVVLGRHLTYEASEKIKSFNIKGVYLSKENVRYYPEKTLAAQLLGYVDGEGVGKYGLEQYFDEELAGEPGLYSAEIDPFGRRIAFGESVLKESVDGTDLVLTINRDVQTEAEKLLSTTVKKFHADSGSIIVMNPENGEIVAMANSPTFDPNEYTKVKDYNLFKNASVMNLFEPGSIFKVITVAAGLDTGKIEPDTEYTDTGSINLDGHKIMNSDRKANGVQTMTQVLEKSLNTGTVFILEQMGKNTFFEYLTDKFNFGSRLGIEQPLEGEGRVYSPDEVNDHTYATMSFGQSITSTPLQMITAFASVANGGMLVRPHLVAEKIYPDGTKEETDKRPIKQILSTEATAKLKKMMVAVVKNGHGKQAAVEGYEVAGKTGTAQVPREDGNGYYTNKNIGSFIGFGPAESPRFVVLTKIDNPKGVPWAETTAAPVVSEMLDFLFKYYQIPPTEVE